MIRVTSIEYKLRDGDEKVEADLSVIFDYTIKISGFQIVRAVRDMGLIRLRVLEVQFPNNINLLLHSDKVQMANDILDEFKRVRNIPL